MRRGVKWTIIIAVFCLIIVALGFVIYFTVVRKDVYHVADVDHTTYQASDFKGSELKFYKNGTFHLKIVYHEDQLFFLGIGTYVKQHDAYVLQFTQAVGRQGDTVSDQMSHFTAPLACHKSGSWLKFVDHNSQIYYFG